MSVCTREPDGQVRHTYATTPIMRDGVNERGIDLLCAAWRLLDLTPVGRGDWYSELDSS